MSAVAMLELKQRISRLSKRELRELSDDMIRLRGEAPHRKFARVKMRRDPVTGIPYFTPSQNSPPLTLTKVKRVLRDSR
jgi:hypothetical protein